MVVALNIRPTAMDKIYDLPVDYTTLEWYERREVREQYIKEQKGKCFYCKCALTDDPPKKLLENKINWRLFPDNFLKYPVHLQHDHHTYMTEGAVHAYCNAYMWQYEGR